MRPQTGGEFTLVNRNSGKVLDVKSGSTADGAR
ncbi:RICIN domain-containing protein [Streptomyces europaeiscabiei]|nr:RICIN domain-containing protein [Streptomyces europaeiscabiei]